MIKLHILFRSSATGEEVLGAVPDVDDLALLQHDGDAIPVSAYLSEVDAVVTASGGFAFARKGALVECEVFSLAAHDEKQAMRDAAIMALAPTIREDLFPGFQTEVERKAQRAAIREEARRKAAAAAPGKGGAP